MNTWEAVKGQAIENLVTYVERKVTDTVWDLERPEEWVQGGREKPAREAMAVEHAVRKAVLWNGLLQRAQAERDDQIRGAVAMGATHQQVADAMGVTRQLIGLIIKG